MIDWWTVPGRIWDVKNLDFKVELYPDDDVTTKNLDDYSTADEIALERGAWRFVDLVVIPVGEDLTDHIGARQSLRGVEWGEMPDGRIDRWDLMDRIKELAEQAVIELDRIGFKVETAEGSDFAPERLTVPF